MGASSTYSGFSQRFCPQALGKRQHPGCPGSSCGVRGRWRYEVLLGGGAVKHTTAGVKRGFRLPLPLSAPFEIRRNSRLQRQTSCQALPRTGCKSSAVPRLGCGAKTVRPAHTATMGQRTYRQMGTCCDASAAGAIRKPSHGTRRAVKTNCSAQQISRSLRRSGLCAVDSLDAATK